MKSKIKIQLAREFRKTPTRSEKIMWDVLKNRQFMDLKFRRQHIIDGYIVDFYCSDFRFVVEIDGDIHQRQMQDDRERQEIIEAKGIKFFRVKSGEVEKNIDDILGKLKIFIFFVF